MKSVPDVDIIVYGATGYTGRLVAEHFARNYGRDSGIQWAMAGRSADKLAAVRDEIKAPPTTPLIVADTSDPSSLSAMVARTKALLTTVGPYQQYGTELVAACVSAGRDYLDLCGEAIWMRSMIEQHEDEAKRTGARILFSCGFDSVPSELGVWFCQEAAKATFGDVVPRVKGRVRALRGGLSGGTTSTGRATRQAIKDDPSLRPILESPFGLTPGFRGPSQPSGLEAVDDPDVGPVAPFRMSPINVKTVHRSNLLMGHRYGTGFVYDEMAMVGPGGPAEFTDLSSTPAGAPPPGAGPSREEREAGFYDLLFIGLDDDGRRVRVSVTGDMDPGYGSTAKILAETGICLVETPDVLGGVWTPGAALQERLVARLRSHAGLTFVVEAEPT